MVSYPGWGVASRLRRVASQVIASSDQRGDDARAQSVSFPSLIFNVTTRQIA
ncbi:MAG: hypothetical protein KatS3mg059_0006 [Thermomicrobiales bacterium]|nr:MAG: hypothetical protein KatS3mg059_0006 [Thermomicrobiales bacterium]